VTMREFANQKALQDYVELHDLVYLWEDGRAFTSRYERLSPQQREIVAVRTKRGVTKALLFAKATLRAEFEGHEALAIKRKRLQAKRAAKKAKSERRELQGAPRASDKAQAVTDEASGQGSDRRS